MNISELKLNKESFPLSQNTLTWNEGEVIDPNYSVTASLPKVFAYHPDPRSMPGAIWIKELGYELSLHVIYIANPEKKSIYELMGFYTSEAFKYLESHGITFPGRDLHGFEVKTNNREWYRATYSYMLKHKDLYNGFYWFEKIYLKLFSQKVINDAGYTKNKVYTEYKTLDFFRKNPGSESDQSYYALIYSYDDVGTVNHEQVIKTINAISESTEFIK